MTVRRTSWSALGLAGALGAAMLLNRRATLAIDHANDVRDRLAAVAVADDAIDVGVLGIRAGVVRHFDALAREVHALRAADGLAKEAQLRGGGNAQAVEALDKLTSEVRQKEQWVEQLKTDTALLWNSSRHLPVALAAIHTPSEPLDRFRLEVARLGVSSSRELDERLGGAVAAVEAEPAPADEAGKAALRTALGHARAMLEHRRRIDQLTQSILHSPVRASGAALRADFARAERRAVIVATAAQAGAVALGILEAATLLDLLRAWRARRRAVPAGSVP